MPGIIFTNSNVQTLKPIDTLSSFFIFFEYDSVIGSIHINGIKAKPPTTVEIIIKIKAIFFNALSLFSLLSLALYNSVAHPHLGQITASSTS